MRSGVKFENGIGELFYWSSPNYVASSSIVRVRAKPTSDLNSAPSNCYRKCESSRIVGDYA